MARKPKNAAPDAATAPVATAPVVAAPPAFGAPPASFTPPVAGGVNTDELARIVVATVNHPHYTFASFDKFDALEKLALIEVNREVTDPTTGNPAVRARLPDAQNYLDAIGATHTMDTQTLTPVAPVAAPRFELDDNVTVPAIKRGGNLGGTKTSIYPFDTMGVGQSFHLRQTAECENPSKKYASMVSTANARYAFDVKDEAGNVVMEDGTDKAGNAIKVAKRDYSKKFLIRKVDETDPRGPGARVFRTK